MAAKICMGSFLPCGQKGAYCLCGGHYNLSQTNSPAMLSSSAIKWWIQRSVYFSLYKGQSLLNSARNRGSHPMMVPSTLSIPRTHGGASPHMHLLRTMIKQHSRVLDSSQEPMQQISTFSDEEPAVASSSFGSGRGPDLLLLTRLWVDFGSSR